MLILQTCQNAGTSNMTECWYFIHDRMLWPGMDIMTHFNMFLHHVIFSNGKLVFYPRCLELFLMKPSLKHLFNFIRVRTVMRRLPILLTIMDIMRKTQRYYAAFFLHQPTQNSLIFLPLKWWQELYSKKHGRVVASLVYWNN